MDPNCAGLALLAITRNSTQATHTAAEKPLAGSTTAPSNFQSNANVQPFQRRVGRGRARVTWPGETRRRVSTVGVLLERNLRTTAWPRANVRYVGIHARPSSKVICHRACRTLRVPLTAISFIGDFRTPDSRSGTSSTTGIRKSTQSATIAASLDHLVRDREQCRRDR